MFRRFRAFLNKLIQGSFFKNESSKAIFELNVTQKLFCEWNAERLNISLDESRRRFIESWNSMRNGCAGAEYRRFCITSYKLYQVFVEDNEKEIFDCYQFHSHLQFLRMLSYKDPEIEQNHDVFQILKNRDKVVILDFGCGLAQYSRSLAIRLRDEKCEVRLVLTDIPTMRKPFLLWVGEKIGVPISFLDCIQSKPIPDLPFCDACIATDVLEHLYNPLNYLEAFDNALALGGLFITDVSDHKKEFMHISPNLEEVRNRLSHLGYKEIHTNRLYQKRHVINEHEPYSLFGKESFKNFRLF